MDRTVAALSRILRFAQAMDPDVRPVDEALPALRRLLEAAGVPYKLAGGVAVIHHGYLRTTDDIDVLLTPADSARLDPLLSAHGFERVSEARLRHADTGVRIDLLLAGHRVPRPGSRPYPAPAALGASRDASDVVDLAGLLELKLGAGRHQDRADVVALLKPMNDGEYLAVESQVPTELRSELLRLRRDALEERSWEQDS